MMLDSNILIDKLCKRQPFYETSSRVFLLGVFGDAELYISVTMLTDIHYVLSKQYGNKEAQDILQENLGMLKLCGVSAEDGLWSLRQRWDDFEECLVARCAENVKADYIITRDKTGFGKSLVPTLTPEELFVLLNDREGLSYHEIDLEVPGSAQ